MENDGVPLIREIKGPAGTSANGRRSKGDYWNRHPLTAQDGEKEKGKVAREKQRGGFGWRSYPQELLRPETYTGTQTAKVESSTGWQHIDLNQGTVSDDCRGKERGV